MSKAIKLRMMPEFGGTCLWDDEEGLGTGLSSYFPESPEQDALEDRMWEWLTWYCKVEPAVPAHNFDWAGFHRQGMDIARDIKRLYGEKIILIYDKAYEDPNADKDQLTLIE